VSIETTAKDYNIPDLVNQLKIYLLEDSVQLQQCQQLAVQAPPNPLCNAIAIWNCVTVVLATVAYFDDET